MKKPLQRIHRLQVRFILTLSLLASTLAASGQDCFTTIKEATALYDQGKFTEAIEKIEPCAQSEDIRIKWQSQRLLAMTYLALNENVKAREAARTMLELNPRYKPNVIHDPGELVKLLNSIPVIPRFSLGLALSAGVNYTLPSINNVYMISEQTKYYTGRSGVQFGISSSYQFNQRFALQALLLVTNKRFTIDYSFANWSLQSKESLTYLHLPIMGRYYTSLKGKIRPYVQLGGFAGALMYTDNSFYASYIPDGTKYSLEHISSLQRRKRTDWGFCGGIGAFFKVGDGQAFFEMNLLQSMVNIARPAVRYENGELMGTYYYMDDDVQLHSFGLAIGYSIYLDYKVLEDK